MTVCAAKAERWRTVIWSAFEDFELHIVLTTATAAVTFVAAICFRKGYGLNYCRFRRRNQDELADLIAGVINLGLIVIGVVDQYAPLAPVAVVHHAAESMN